MATAKTSAWSTKQLVVMALLTAIALLLSFFPEFPIFPAAPYLKYDASFVPIMVVAFAYGPGAGMSVGIVAWTIHCFITGDLIGWCMTMLVLMCFMIPAALIYKNNRTMKGAILGLAVGFIASVAGAIVGNLIFTPMYGTPFDVVLTLVVPVLLPFNVLKAALNSVLTLVVYKSIKNLITPEKDQVKGK